MAYLGNVPARSFISFERQVFTIVNSQTAYTLSHSVTNENDIRLVVNNVVQEPGSGKAYTATGTALTLSAALTNGTDEMYCVFLGRATATNAPGAGSVGTSQLAADAVTTAKILNLNVTSGKIADDAVTLAKMASGTDGNIISYDASGNPVAVATGSAGQILTSAGAGAPPTFAAAGVNTPAFFAYPTAEQDLANNTTVQVVLNAELYDTANAFASNAFTVPSGQGGKYVLNCGIRRNNWTSDRFYTIVKKGGAAIFEMDSYGKSYSTNNGFTMQQLAAGDVITLFAYQNNGSTQSIHAGSASTFFCGYKIIE